MMFDIISFRKTIPANSADWIADRIKGKGVIKKIQVRFYLQAQELQITPYIERKGAQLQPLIRFPSTTNQYLSGDDDILTYEVFIPVENDEYIKIFAKNINAVDDYDLAVDVIIQYEGGI